MIELDAFDRRILARYQADTRTTAEAIGAAIGLSTAAVYRRLKRLRDEGVIAAEVAVVDAATVGLSTTAIVSVDIDRERAEDLARFEARISACPEVQQCWYVTGRADYVLVVVTADLPAYEAFTRAHLLSDPNVRSFETQVVLRSVKRGLRVPV
ncbi:MAG: Lrp/AsnC family transcriptional regulator [Myxococcota bacterium]